MERKEVDLNRAGWLSEFSPRLTPRRAALSSSPDRRVDEALRRRCGCAISPMSWPAWFRSRKSTSPDAATSTLSATWALKGRLSSILPRAIFMVVRTRENGAYFQRLYKLDTVTGIDKQPPAVIEAGAGSSAADAGRWPTTLR